jgi:hypothetical protein
LSISASSAGAVSSDRSALGRQALGRALGQHRADAGMGVLHVEHRVLVVLLERQVDVEGELGVGLAADQEEAHRVAAGPVDQVAQRDVAAARLLILTSAPLRITRTMVCST